MIYGIGIDIVELCRIELTDRFVDRILSDNEKEILNSFNKDKRKIEFLAGRFACKEAVAKALGTGIGKISFKDIEILPDSNGKPICHIAGYIVHVSISHSEHYAVAEAIIEKE